MVEAITAPALAALAGIGHGFFTRRGGVSEGIYNALNCGPGSGDDRTKVMENRARVARTLGAAAGWLISPWQVHSATVVTATEPWPADSPDRPKADGIVTAVPGLAIGVLTADCAPVLFADARAGVVGAAHAGWRGALAGVLEATIAAMEQLGAHRGDITAALGPCIGPANYEVGPEFEAEFLRAAPGSERYFRRVADTGRPRFDLPGFVLSRLRQAGIGTLDERALCTYEDESRFFSYRRTTHRGEADYGRQISAILIK